jgi:DNA-binding IscR family transcriptional regulator
MSANSRFASAVHIMTFLGYIGPDGSNSKTIARSLNTNPVVIRTLLKDLANEGLVELRRGRLGGVHLARSPDQIDLGQIYRAIGRDSSALLMRDAFNPRCIVARTMLTSLPPLFDAANDAVAASLQQTSLGSLLADVRQETGAAAR